MLEIKKKGLIICSACELEGKRSILAELGTAGEFIIRRFHEFETIIEAPILKISCGVCGNVAYKKNERTLGPGLVRVHREEVSLSFAGTL